jgi:pimeloyl-ACP methyl ester carboxylesterase
MHRKNLMPWSSVGVAPLVAGLIICLPMVCAAQPSNQQVEFPSGDITLSGTLVKPSNMIAAVVLVHGSDRVGRNIAFAESLAREGVATLTYDKRGVGKSGGVYAGPEVGTNNVDPHNLDLLASDARAAVEELERQISFAKIPVGLIGASQAGWIIPLAAARTPQVSFMILWSGPVVSVLEQLRFQFLTNGQEDFWQYHTEAEVHNHIRSDPDRYRFVDTDPRDSLRMLSVPGLWLYGNRDIQVPVRLSIERLQALIANGKPFEYDIIADSGHELPAGPALAQSIKWLKKTFPQINPPR